VMRAGGGHARGLVRMATVTDRDAGIC